MKKITLYLIILFAVSNILADDANQIIQKVKDNLDKIKDYSANLAINIDINYINIPEKKGTILYKKPDKLKINIDGLSMLPKQGVGDFIGKILEDKTNTYIFGGEEKLKNQNTSIVKIIPSNPKSDIVLSSFWIFNDVVLQAEITTKQNGTFLIEITNTKIENISIPKEVIIKFRVPKFNIPKSFISAKDKEKLEKDIKDDDSGSTEGTVKIAYSDYKINKKIADELFK